MRKRGNLRRRGTSRRRRKDRMTIDNPNTMKVLITGGGGFLGARLARTILQRGHLSGRPVRELVLADLVPPPPDVAADERVRASTGALIDQAKTLGQENFDLVFHLAAAVSAECEANLDLGLRSNVDTTRALLDALRDGGDGRVLSSPVRWLSSAAMSTCPCRVSSTTTLCLCRSRRMECRNLSANNWWRTIPGAG